MICKLKNSKKISDVCTWLQDSKGKYYQKKKKEQRRKGKGENKIKSLTPPVADVSQRENYCTKRRNWSAIAKCYRGNKKLEDELLKKKCIVLMLRIKAKQEQKIRKALIHKGITLVIFAFRMRHLKGHNVPYQYH